MQKVSLTNCAPIDAVQGQSLLTGQPSPSSSVHGCFRGWPSSGEIEQRFPLTVTDSFNHLISQLPFGPKDRLDNLESVYLTLGSPTLAAFSLALTILNRRWISRRFSKCTFPNARNAVDVLIGLQQAPLRVSSDNAAYLMSSEGDALLAPSEDATLLASLVVLPQNDRWWRELIERLDSPHTWSVSSIASIAWVTTAYVFTVVDWFTGEFAENPSSAGQAVGALFLWLLAVVVGWLLLSPKCDEGRLEDAMDRANKLLYVATDTGVVPARELPDGRRAMTLDFNIDEDDPIAVLRTDERNTAPIYNYARFLPWVQSVETVFASFQAASIRCQQRESVDRREKWIDVEDDEKPDMRNRMGSSSQVTKYCSMASLRLPVKRSRWGPNVVSRIVTASLLALLLQWGTVGGAVIVVYYTPTVGESLELSASVSFRLTNIRVHRLGL